MFNDGGQFHPGVFAEKHKNNVLYFRPKTHVELIFKSLEGFLLEREKEKKWTTIFTQMCSETQEECSVSQKTAPGSEKSRNLWVYVVFVNLEKEK